MYYFIVEVDMSSCLIHAGSDRCLIYTEDESVVLWRNDLHQTLPPILHQLTQKGLDDVRVVTGPGSFTIIRVCSVLLNGRQSLSKNQITFHTTTKEQMYLWLWNQGQIPRYSVIFIGQKKNARRYDHQTQTYTVRPYADIVSEKSDYLLDKTEEQPLDHDQIERSRNNGPSILWRGNQHNIQSGPWQLTTSITPHYGVEPLSQ